MDCFCSCFLQPGCVNTTEMDIRKCRRMKNPHRVKKVKLQWQRCDVFASPWRRRSSKNSPFYKTITYSYLFATNIHMARYCECWKKYVYFFQSVDLLINNLIISTQLLNEIYFHASNHFWITNIVSLLILQEHNALWLTHQLFPCSIYTAGN